MEFLIGPRGCSLGATREPTPLELIRQASLICPISVEKAIIWPGAAIEIVRRHESLLDLFRDGYFAISLSGTLLSRVYYNFFDGITWLVWANSLIFIHKLRRFPHFSFQPRPPRATF